MFRKNNKVLDSYFFVLFSLIPTSIILGPAISLFNILLINFSFLFLLIFTKEYKFLSNKTVKLILIFYLYLIFNSIVSENFSIGALRNFGFIRFIILFFAFNYFFYHKNFFNKILIIWALTLFIITIDTYIESFVGTNILGYGKIYGARIVSFFKDEPIVGGYINSFYLIIVGYFFSLNLKFSENYRYFILAVSLLFLWAIILTGERSNAIKAIFGFMIFYFINHHFKIKEKLISVLLILIVIGSLINNSDFLKLRYNELLINPILTFFYIEVKKIEHGSDFEVELGSLYEAYIEHGSDFEVELGSLYKVYKDSGFDGSFNDYLNLTKNVSNLGMYASLYKSAYSVFKSYPFFGAGNKNYRHVTCAKNKNPKYICTTHPHQTYFEFLSEHGLIGTIAILYIIFNLVFGKLKIVLQSKNYTQIGCFVFLSTSFIPLLPSGAFFSDYNITIFWLNLSLMYSVNKKTNIFSKN